MPPPAPTPQTPVEDPQPRAAVPRRSSPWTSRWLVLVIFGWIAAFGAAAYFRSLRPLSAKVIESPLKPFDGRWAGEERRYRWDGTDPTRREVRLTFRHVAEREHFRQEGRIEIAEPGEGAPGVEQVIQLADFERRGLIRRRLPDAGRKVIEYEGRLEAGAVIWFRSGPDGLESLREWVEGDTYAREGVIIPADRAAPPWIITGRFRRVLEDEPAPRADGAAGAARP